MFRIIRAAVSCAYISICPIAADTVDQYRDILGDWAVRGEAYRDACGIGCSEIEYPKGMMRHAVAEIVDDAGSDGQRLVVAFASRGIQSAAREGEVHLDWNLAARSFIDVLRKQHPSDVVEKNVAQGLARPFDAHESVSANDGEDRILHRERGGMADVVNVADDGDVEPFAVAPKLLERSDLDGDPRPAGGEGGIGLTMRFERLLVGFEPGEGCECKSADGRHRYDGRNNQGRAPIPFFGFPALFLVSSPLMVFGVLRRPIDVRLYLIGLGGMLIGTVGSVVLFTYLMS